MLSIGAVTLAKAPAPVKPNAQPAAQKAAPVAQAPAVNLEDKLCKGINNTYDCAQIIERYQISKLNAGGQKNLVSKQLKLTLKDGKAKLLEDGLQKGPLFSFRDYLSDLGYFIVHVQHYEGDAYLMVNDKTGTEYTLPGLPVLSPNKSKLVVASYDLLAGYNPNTIQVWKVGPNEMIREMALEPEPTDWGVSDVSWVDDKTVLFTKNTITEDKALACYVKRMKLIQTEKGWKMTEA